MKIKNLAFYGVMAAILGSVGTARADDSTIIASKGYVDAYAQKQSDRYQGTWSAATPTQKSSTALYPSMHTLEDAVGDSVNGLDYTQTATGVVKTVNQTDGLIAVTAGTVDTAEISDGAVTGDKIGTGAVTYTKVNSAAKQEAQVLEPGDSVTPWSENDAPNDKFPTVKAVAQQIGAINLSSAVEHGPNALLMEDDDEKAPSVIAVKGITDNTTTDYTTRDASSHVLTGSGSTTKVPTTAALVGALQDLDMTELNNLNQTTAEHEKAVTKISQVDGRVYAEMGQIGSDGIKTGGVKTTNIADNNVTFAKISDKTTSQSGTVVPWNTAEIDTNSAAYTPDDKFPTVKAVAQQIATNAVAPNTAITASTDHSIVTYDAKGLVTGGIALPTLNDINSPTADAACTQGAPCVLSYYVDNGTKYYKWTNMDTEGLNAVNDSNS